MRTLRLVPPLAVLFLPPFSFFSRFRITRIFAVWKTVFIAFFFF